MMDAIEAAVAAYRNGGCSGATRGEVEAKAMRAAIAAYCRNVEMPESMIADGSYVSPAQFERVCRALRAILEKQNAD